MKESMDTIIHVRVDKALHDELKSEAGSLGYKKMGPYLRLIMERRNAKVIRKADIPQGSITAIEHLSAEIRRVGVLYNQFVASYNKAVLLKGPDGTPSVSTKETQRNQLGLMELTMDMVDSMHSLMDHFGISHDRAKILDEQPTENNRPSMKEGKVIIPKF